MKALILAAGFGSRLQSLTKETPKALIKIKNKPVILYVIEKLINEGISEIIVNAYCHKEKLINFLENSQYSKNIQISEEESLLNTGGSIKRVLESFKTNDLLIYNTDVLCTVNLNKLITFHKKKNSLVTLVMQTRESNSQLPVDENSRICGLKLLKQQKQIIVQKPAGKTKDLAFCGIHLLSSKIIEYLPEEDTFPVISWYLDIMKKNSEFYAFELNKKDYWLDMGTPEKLAKAKNDFYLWKP